MPSFAFFSRPQWWNNIIKRETIPLNEKGILSKRNVSQHPEINQDVTTYFSALNKQSHIISLSWSICRHSDQNSCNARHYRTYE